MSIYDSQTGKSDLAVDDLSMIKRGKTAEELFKSNSSFTPTDAQLAAMNSGITSEKVDQINTNKNNISITDITSHFIASEGYTIQSGISAVYRQGKHIFGTLSIKINSGNLPTTLTTIALNVTDIPNSRILMSCGCGVDEMSIDSIGTCYYNNFLGVIQCKDTVSTNTCFNLQLDFIAI